MKYSGHFKHQKIISLSIHTFKAQHKMKYIQLSKKSHKFFIIIGSASLIYIVIFILMYNKQRDIQYIPDSRHFTAKQIGLTDFTDESIHTSDGENLIAYYKPAQAGQVTVLYFHGNADRSYQRQSRKILLTENGRGLLYIGFRGYSGSTGSPSEDGLKRDADAAYAWLASRVPAHSIVIYGESLGTGVAIDLAGRVKAKAVVLDAPYTAAVDVAANMFPWLPVNLLMKDQFHSLELIGKLTSPLLVIHGTRDQVIPFAMGKSIYDAATVPKLFVTIADGDHHSNIENASGIFSEFIARLGPND